MRAKYRKLKKQQDERGLEQKASYFPPQEESKKVLYPRKGKDLRELYEMDGQETMHPQANVPGSGLILREDEQATRQQDFSAVVGCAVRETR